MIRDDKSKFLLFMEPKVSERLKEPIEDEWVKVVERALSESKEGTSTYSHPDLEDIFTENIQYRGSHVTECGERSLNVDYLLPNGLITNSLAPFYLKYYRKSICENDWVKLRSLYDYYRGKEVVSSIYNSSSFVNLNDPKLGAQVKKVISFGGSKEMVYRNFKSDFGGSKEMVYRNFKSRKFQSTDSNFEKKMLDSYIETALWSSIDYDGEPLDNSYRREDISRTALHTMSADVKQFIKKASSLIVDEDPEQIGHDFWLTRNSHGTGFWDGDYEESKGDKLTKIAKEFGESDLYIGDNNSLYVSSDRMRYTNFTKTESQLPVKSFEEKMLDAYIDSALWSSIDDDGEPLDENFGRSDIDKSSVRLMRLDIVKFIKEAGSLLDGENPEYIGHDFWLTRNGHGAGFWSRGSGKEKGKELSKIADRFGRSDLYVGNRGKLYVS